MPPPDLTPVPRMSRQNRRSSNTHRSQHSSSSRRTRDKENVPPVFSAANQASASPAQQTPTQPIAQTLAPPPPTQPRPSVADAVDEDPYDDDDPFSDDPLREVKDMLASLDANASESIRIATDTQDFYEDSCIAARFLGLYLNHARILTEGLAYVVRKVPAEERPLHTSDEYNASVETDMVWDAVETFLPKLIDCASYILRRDSLIARIAHYLDLVTKNVRGNDLSRLKPNIMKIAGIADPDHAFEDKSRRGWGSKEFAELLVPLTELDVFRADPDGYCAKVEHNEKFILSDDWPACFYDLTKVQPGRAKEGFLLSLFLLRCYKWLITGKGSAFSLYNTARRTRGKPSVAHNGRINFVTLPSILYVACIARYCLTSLTSWSDTDGAHWNGEDFVRSVYRAAFHDPDWVEELEEWWTKQIYGSADEESDALIAKRKDTALKRFLQQCDSGNPRKRSRYNTPSVSS